jgi:aconitate hydratase
MSIFEAARKYKKSETQLVVIAGKEYGTGSSRDWAAKGTLLLGVQAVIAESFERIHRSNLVGMGVLPLQFKSGLSAENLGIDGSEHFDILNFDHSLKPQSVVMVKARKENGDSVNFEAIVRLDTEIEVDYYQNGGILHTVLRNMM